MAKAVYAGFPTAKVFKEPDARSEMIGHLLWGTWIVHLESEPQGQWEKVRIRGWDKDRKEKIGWMRKKDYQSKKVLEVYFIDVAQGDGCLMITPDDKFHLIDAGQGRNMAAYLNWKFNLSKESDKKVFFHNVIISHPDKDHYGGFSSILSKKRTRFRNVWHNGIVERAGVAKDSLGARDEKNLIELVRDEAALDAIIGDSAKIGDKLYPQLLKRIRSNGASSIKMLCSEDEYLPGYGLSNDVKIRVLGPVPITDANGRRTVPWFGEKSKPGETKNGHSIVTQVQFGDVKILLGGDLNIPAENYLLENYTGISPEGSTDAEKKTIIRNARKIFESDVAKACHHGSADFSNVFLQSVNAAATIISSGDDEPHSHPRPDAVGALGKFGRGTRPLIFSTELARSTRDLLIKANPSEKELGRTVAVYGNIELRTDGKKIVIGQRFERKPAHGEWDYYVLEKNAEGVFTYVSKHD